MMALIVQKYHGIPKAYVKEYVKDCEVCRLLNSSKTIQPLINKTSELVKDSLKLLFNNFGVPVAIQSDNGREFKNTLLEAFLTDLNIKIIHGRPRNPKRKDTDGRTWIEHLNNVVYAYNRTIPTKENAAKHNGSTTTIIANDLEIDSKIRSDRLLNLFYDFSVFTVTAILMNNMIEVKNNDGTQEQFLETIRNNRPNIFILDEKKYKITLIEVGITSQDSLQIVETEKLRKYDLLANELGLIYKCSVEIIPYRLQIPMNVAHNLSIVLKKTVETISFDRRRGLESGLNAEKSWEKASMGVIMRAEMHEEPTPFLKEEKREEDGAKNFKPKNNTPLISQGGTTLEEPTNNINEKSDLEETEVVKEVEENI
ncbi:hypothetical protein CWI38_0577p0020 [Hamiltosporidium tvaerminnensis]|uniref:Integrase catalytic domain-containing protein n=1 Tax=Hamiltosporidium tvaerminnensis TaxID=1176355 RepID=A0A4Q9LX98_9MICR|nr:hypothetical protein CWI38_0577p0020 [Hamiltosporidium tvaerminnensis]